MKLSIRIEDQDWFSDEAQSSFSDFLSIFGVRYRGFRRDGDFVVIHYTTSVLTSSLASNAQMTVYDYVKKSVRDYLCGLGGVIDAS